MTTTKSIISVIIGCVLFLVAIFNKHFYARKGYLQTGREVPRWQGQLLCVLGSAFFLAVGLYHLWAD